MRDVEKIPDQLIETIGLLFDREEARAQCLAIKTSVGTGQR